MEKIMKLLGIRRRAILCRSKDGFVTVIQPITEDEEKQIDNIGSINIGNTVIPLKQIYIYGQVNLNCQDDIDYILKFKLINEGETENTIYSNIDWETGEVKYETIPKQYHTWDIIEWFEYNYLLIGRPERVLVYKIHKSRL